MGLHRSANGISKIKHKLQKKPCITAEQYTIHAPRILLVDDDATLRGVLYDLLSAQGYVVECAKHGKEALLYLASAAQLPGLILLDLMMPVMDGYGFRKAQRSNPRIAPIRVVVMTAAGDIKANDVRLDVAAALRKPFSLVTLLDTLKKNYPT